MTFEKKFEGLRESGIVKKIHDVREKMNDMMNELEQPETTDERICEIHGMICGDTGGECESFETKYCGPEEPAE